MHERRLQIAQSRLLLHQSGNGCLGSFHYRDNLLLLIKRRQWESEGAHLGLVRRSEVRCTFRDTVEIALGDVRLHHQRKETGLQELAIWTDSKDVILMEALGDLPLPDRATPELVDVTTFGHQYVADV